MGTVFPQLVRFNIAGWVERREAHDKMTPIDPQDNDRLLEARATTAPPKACLTVGIRASREERICGKSRAHAKKRLLQQKAAKRHPPFWSFAYALSVYMVIALEFRDVLLEPGS